MATRLIELMEKLPRSRVVLVGDLMIDKYLYGNVERLSPEAPVPVLHHEREELRLGGAGNVAACIGALGGQVRMVGVVGDDAMGASVREMLKSCGADASGVITINDRP